jgi:carboxypeptidase T
MLKEYFVSKEYPMKYSFVYALLICMLVLATTAFSAPMSLVRIDKITTSDIKTFANTGYDIAAVGKNHIDIVIEPAELSKLKAQGFVVRILEPDLDAYVVKMKKTQNKTDSYHTVAQVEKKLKDWAIKYPKITHLESIGKSCENRDIWAIKISDNPKVNEQEPSVLIIGAHHSREWPSIEVPMALIEKLLTEYKVNPYITNLVDNREIWIIPVFNPDGVIYSMEKSKFWRKNRRDNKDGSFGVDLNRNYGYLWGNVGSSNNPSSDTYHGTCAYSEPETAALRDLAYRENFQACISYHTYSELILYPFSYSGSAPNPDVKIFKQMAEEMAKITGYTAKNSAGLYPTMGDFDDFMYGEMKALSFTFELCKSFIPPASQISSFTEPNVECALHLIDKAGTYALAIPGNNPTLVNHLDFNSALYALKDINSIFGKEDNLKVRNEVLKQIELINKRIATLVLEEFEKNKDNAWQEIIDEPSASLAIYFIKTRALFNAMHSPKIYSNEVLDLLNL